MDPAGRKASDLSGVHEVTICRRWGSTESLLPPDVATAQLNEEAPFPDTGELRGDLIAWARTAAESQEPEWMICAQLRCYILPTTGRSYSAY